MMTPVIKKNKLAWVALFAMAMMCMTSVAESAPGQASRRRGLLRQTSFDVIEPNTASIVETKDSSAPPPTNPPMGSGCNTDWTNDTFCDPDNNNVECGWDGGDCCLAPINKQWCVDPNSDTCSCLAEQNTTTSVPTPVPTSTTTMHVTCKDEYKGEGHCDPVNNNAECGWDGGDCCLASIDKTFCDDPNSDTCSCLAEQNTTTSVPTPVPTFMVTCDDEYKGEGHCDPFNNNAECEWDGGDCCGITINKKFCADPMEAACNCLDPMFAELTVA